MRANKLRHSSGKTEVLLVSGENAWKLWSQPDLKQVALPLNKQVCRLGVLLDPGIELDT